MQGVEVSSTRFVVVVHGVIISSIRVVVIVHGIVVSSIGVVFESWAGKVHSGRSVHVVVYPTSSSLLVQKAIWLARGERDGWV